MRIIWKGPVFSVMVGLFALLLSGCIVTSPPSQQYVEPTLTSVTEESETEADAEDTEDTEDTDAEDTEEAIEETGEEVAEEVEEGADEEKDPTTSAPAMEDQIHESLGPDAFVIANGDLNNDGKEEVLAALPSSLELSKEFSDPSYVDYDEVVSALIISQEGEEEGDEPVCLLRITTEQITAKGEMLLSFATPESETFSPPAAFLVKYLPDSSVPLAIIPLNSMGGRYMQGIGFAWDTEAQTYRMILAVRTP